MAINVLVTGGNGFIGRHTCQELARRGHTPIVLDRSRHAKADSVILGDIRDPVAVTEAVAHVDAVIHLAGVLGTQETVNNPRPAAETNILGGLNVLEACAQYLVPLVNIAVGNWFEFSTYSITKSTVERFVEMFSRYRDLTAVSVRALNAYGPYQSVSVPYGHSRVRKIMPSFISRALHHQPLQIYGEGQQIMDMIYVEDVARILAVALEKLMELGKPLPLLEAGTGRRTTVLEIAQKVQAEVHRQAGYLPAIEHLPMRPGETPGVEVLGDPGTLAPLGITPADFMGFETGTAVTVKHYLELFGTP